MDVSSQMLTFVRVVEAGSISAASRSSGQTPSALSKQISHLEDHVGYRLLHRTRAGISLTEDGQPFYEKCRAVAEKVQEAEELVLAFGAAPKGQLRVATSVAFGKAQLIPALPRFLELYPDIKISLELTDRHVDLEAEKFDAAISYAEQLTHPDVMTRRIMKNERVICAAPSFIARYGAPNSFEDLENFNCLRTSNGIGRNAWRAEYEGVTHNVNASGNFEGNSGNAVYMAALAGLGIARLSTYLVADKIASGELVRLFPWYTQQHADVAVNFPAKRNLAPKIRVFIDYLAAQFQKG
ncbi:LysR family transcriptional regulator [Abyssibius alkaniclasticus]|uniref:LysR family transcriptional regulator n=1 Tax=Abyssibius alkaniclasticus TaxID=2881234 RepID=UPI0023636248|nr:LysR family transcriptional regulator [Abyssibius alkaniclasticus]UPH72363.1 LysR family transcriptional regulator [Abyssibius alkaniclasticus]|tara:strand:- start:695 stop:1585 length:891 start_codon:yes stop_codon:yes gene_type:complete